jgi:hypothetical protein
MSIERSHVQALRVAIESSSAFASELSGSIGSFTDVRFNSAEMTLSEEMLRDERMVQNFYEEPKDIIGKRSCELNISTYLRGTDTALDDSAGAGGSTPSDSFAKILGTIMGGYSNGGPGDDIETSSTDSIVLVNDGSTFNAGRMCAAEITSGVYEVREIASVDETTTPDEVELKVTTSAAPLTGGNCLNSHLFYLADDPLSALQFIVEPEQGSQESAFWLLGMQGTLSLTFTVNGLITCDFSLKGADWKADRDVGTPLNSTFSGVADYATDDPGTPVCWSGALLIADTTETVPANGNTWTQKALLDASSLTIDINFDYTPITSPSGTNGIARWRMNPNRPTVTGSFTVPWDPDSQVPDTTSPQGDFWHTSRTDRSEFHLMTQAGQTAGGMVGVTVPRFQITDTQITDVDGIQSVTNSFKALNDIYSTTAAGGSGSANEQRRSPLRIARM